MKTESGLYYGKVACDIQVLFVDPCVRLPAFKSAVVTCLDSDRQPHRILNVFRKFRIEAHLDLAEVLISKMDFVRAVIEPGLFVGFDEVLMFEGDRLSQEIRRPFFLTFDAADFTLCLPDGLEEYMKASKCVLALGDGCGLNFATWDGDLATSIENVAS